MIWLTGLKHKNVAGRVLSEPVHPSVFLLLMQEELNETKTFPGSFG